MNWVASFIGGPAYAVGATLLRHWKWVALGSLAIFAGIQTLRLSWTQTALEKLTGQIRVMQAVTEETDKRWRATENTWRVNTASIKKERDDEYKAIAAERDAALSELRNRPRRPAPGTTESTTNGQAASGCTGAQLYGNDAEFLIREAARADGTRIALKACYAQYDMIAGGVE